jgi:hypothetical protein
MLLADDSGDEERAQALEVLHEAADIAFRLFGAILAPEMHVTLVFRHESDPRCGSLLTEDPDPEAMCSLVIGATPKLIETIYEEED